MNSSVNDSVFGKFKFLKDPTFARHPKFQDEPCYRLILCYALFQSYKDNNWNLTGIEEEVAKLSSCYDLPVLETNCIYYFAGYLEIYKYKFKNGEDGYSLVDKSGGIYPLICYPYPNSSFKGEAAKERAKAFRAALDSVAKYQKEKILKSFAAHKAWDELQSELTIIFHGRSSNKKAA